MSDDNFYVSGAEVRLTQVSEVPEPGETWEYNGAEHIVIKSKVIWPRGRDDPHLVMQLAPKMDIRYWGEWKSEQEVRDRAQELLGGEQDG